jgi:hypothetical protein
MNRLRRLLGESSAKNAPPTPDAWERSAGVTMFLAEVPDPIRPILRGLVEGTSGRRDTAPIDSVRPAARESMVRHMRMLIEAPAAKAGGV